MPNLPIDPSTGKATAIKLLNFSSPQMRAFHMSWFAFFLCFFAWFGIAPFMPQIREEMSLTKAQFGNLIIGSVAMTVIARLLIGWICDRYGPRLAYTWLLITGSIPVMLVGFAQTYESLLVFRVMIGAIGASFVITQYHTSLMFAPNCVGTANATSAGWGNLGGGVANMIMPFIAAAFIWGGASEFFGWRLAMTTAGVVCMLTGIAYFFLTQDCPQGNFKEVKKQREQANKQSKEANTGSAIGSVVSDYRVWILFAVYAACFGVELTINNIAATYYHDRFGLTPWLAGLIGGLFGLMNIFARTMGGFFGDRLGRKWGLRGRVRWLCIALLGEAIALVCFSQMSFLPIAIGSMIVFSLFVQMSEGATYSVVPFINKRGLGLVAGIVGAGGNIGAVSAGFLFKGDLAIQSVFLIIAACVACCAVAAFLIRFRPEEEKAARNELLQSVQSRQSTPGAAATTAVAA